MDVDPQSIKSGFDLLKSALETLKSFREVFRGSPSDATRLEAQIADAEKQVALAEAQLAAALGYVLCRAHFPPVPMLVHRVEPTYVETISRCPTCSREEPPQEYFIRLQRIDAAADDHNERMARGVS